MGDNSEAESFITRWRDTGGSELANTQSFINELCALIGVSPPDGSQADDARNDYVFERRVFQDNGDGTTSFGRTDVYKRGAFILEAKQGSDADRAAAERGEDDLDLFGQTASVRMKRGTARRGTPGWAKAMVQAKGQAQRYAKALPVDHGWPPFLLVADIGYCIEVYADFTSTGKAYAQFLDRARYRIMLKDLVGPDVGKRLAAIWTSLRRSTHASKRYARRCRTARHCIAPTGGARPFCRSGQRLPLSRSIHHVRGAHRCALAARQLQDAAARAVRPSRASSLPAIRAVEYDGQALIG